MDYIELTFRLSPRLPAADILVCELADLGFESFVDTPTGFQAFIAADHWDQTAVSACIIEHAALGEIHWEQKHVPAQNWNAVWESEFQPVLVGDSCVIRAPFHPKPEGVTFDLIIQPQMSFGTGHHETTFLMVQKLLTMDLVGRSLMDYGSGTGVLAILAALRGAAPVSAIDIEENAVLNARENAANNNVAFISVEQGDKSRLSGLMFDVILANINRNVLLDSFQACAQSLNSGGHLLLSGFFHTDIPALETAAAVHGFSKSDEARKSEWALLHLVRS
ncbi:MAG: 50S ribosomal protein L11 methyltransferase [Bacteroidia bacterium]